MYLRDGVICSRLRIIGPLNFDFVEMFVNDSSASPLHNFLARLNFYFIGTFRALWDAAHSLVVLLKELTALIWY